MPVADFKNVPWEMWWLFLGVFLFGIFLPFATAQSVLKVWFSISPNRDADRNDQYGFWKKMVIGWVTLVPVYALSLYYIQTQLAKL